MDSLLSHFGLGRYFPSDKKLFLWLLNGVVVNFVYLELKFLGFSFNN